VKYLSWLLKAAIFFTLFAFALNNQQTVAVNFFFGTMWKAPLVLVVLATFSIGLALGVLLMMPRWWKKRQTKPQANAESAALTAQSQSKPGNALPDNPSIPRHGL
jgi:lipopolysaccharide assembly protein A